MGFLFQTQIQESCTRDIMKRTLFALTILVFIITGCGVTLSDYEDAVLDGVSNLNLNKPEKALKDFNRAIDIDPTRADAYVGRANTLSTLGRYAGHCRTTTGPLKSTRNWPMLTPTGDRPTAKRASTKRPSRTMKRPWNWTPKSTMRRVL